MHRNRQTKRRQTHEPEDFTDSIRDMEREAFQLLTERNEYAEQALRIKTDALMEVEAEWENFKWKSHSNQMKRNVVADEKLVLNETYTAIITEIKAIDAILKELAINISFERRQFSRETNHIADIHDVQVALTQIAKDVHGFTTALEEA